MSKKMLQDSNENIEMIRKMYEEEFLTYTEIGERLNIKPDVIRRFMIRNSIEIRKHSETIKLKNGIENNIEEIKRLFIEKELSTSTIGDMYNVNRKTITNYLVRFGVDVEGISKSRKTDLQKKNLEKTKKIKLSDEELLNLYCNDNHTASEIANMFDATPRTVLIRLHELGVEIKQLKDLLEDEDYREKHINRMKSAITEKSYLKRAKTNMQRYGVDNPFKSAYFQNKALETKYKEYKQKTSFQQMYLYKIIGGELNYCMGTCSLDIAFPNEKIYIEYDGGGHDLNVTLNKITQEDFDKKEFKRNFYLSRRGWRLIRIISKKDRLPNDEKIKEMIKYGEEYLNNGRHYIIFDIDNNIVRTSQYEKGYDYGITRIIRRAS